MINIYMRNSDNQWVRGLEIPLEDIQRFSLRPLKWLRFVTFTVLGAKGHLLDAPNGNIVNYDTFSVTDGESYYFFPDGCYHLVDSSGLADHITSSVSTPRRTTFRHDVAQRDNNRCVITGVRDDACHAVHIIPHSKGDQYIRLVILDRRSLYEDQQVDLRNDISIDSARNGLLLSPGLHDRCGREWSAFLRTPNFALDPADIPRVESGQTPASRTTVQHIKPWGGWFPVPQGDVRADWDVQDAPLSILLDYMYDAAVIRRWATADIRSLLEEHHETHFKIANTVSSIPKDNGGVQPDDDNESVNPTDTVYVAPRGTAQHR